MKKPRVRRTWGTLKPTTRVKQSKKVYKRKKIVVGDEWHISCCGPW